MRRKKRYSRNLHLVKEVRYREEPSKWYVWALRLLQLVAAIATIITLIAWWLVEVPAIREQRALIKWSYIKDAKSTLQTPDKSNSEYRQALIAYAGSYAPSAALDISSVYHNNNGINLSKITIFNLEIPNLIARGGNFSGTILLQSSFESCDFRNTNLSFSYLNGTSFKHCKFNNANLYNANISSVDFEYVSGLTQAMFNEAKYDRGFEPKNLPDNIHLTNDMVSVHAAEPL